MNASPGFTINGRFLTQRMTGVQRYAQNIVLAMDAALAQQGGQGRIAAPAGARTLPTDTITQWEVTPLSGHAWEQMVLPRHVEGRLLNLCNTAPVAIRDQIVCIHDANVFAAPESYGAAIRRVYGMMQPLLVRRAARITTVSPFAARQISRYLPIRAGDVVVLPNGHEHALEWRAERAVKARKLPGARPFVLTLGSQARHKNLALIAGIAPQLDAAGIDVIVAGGSSGIFEPAVLAAAPNLKMAGAVSDDDLAYLLDRALCLAFPSWTEGFGLPIVEAMARGCPVVSSDRASMPDVCGDAALLAAPDDPAAWIRHITALAGSGMMHEDLSGRGRQRVRLFSWKASAQGYLDLLADPVRSVAPAAVAMPRGRVTVAVATRGRPEVVEATVRHLIATQTVPPERILVSCTQASDAGTLAGLPGVEVLTGRPGLPAQRNTALAAVAPGTEVLAFFDDDFVADRDWLAVALRSFRDDPKLVGFTGRVLADGIKGPGIPFAEARAMVEAAPPACDWSWEVPYSPYGCNMAFRFPRIGDLRFDERLVLYGWLEDRDFAATLARRGGVLGRCAEARGVHMGTKGGRVSGVRLGYSQVANPLYMLTKRTMTPVQVAGQILRNVGSNAALSLRPEPFIDRRGRLKGNLLGFTDVARGRFAPERAADL